MNCQSAISILCASSDNTVVAEQQQQQQQQPLSWTPSSMGQLLGLSSQLHLYSTHQTATKAMTATAAGLAQQHSVQQPPGSDLDGPGLYSTQRWGRARLDSQLPAVALGCPQLSHLDCSAWVHISESQCTDAPALTAS
jgi:hypothetical protein